MNTIEFKKVRLREALKELSFTVMGYGTEEEISAMARSMAHEKARKVLKEIDK